MRMATRGIILAVAPVPLEIFDLEWDSMLSYNISKSCKTD